MACIARQATAEPENHEAICSDPVELLAQDSEHRDESAYQVVRKGSDAFPAISGPAAATLRRRAATDRGGPAMSESERATSPIAPLWSH